MHGLFVAVYDTTWIVDHTSFLLSTLQEEYLFQMVYNTDIFNADELYNYKYILTNSNYADYLIISEKTVVFFLYIQGTDNLNTTIHSL